MIRSLLLPIAAAFALSACDGTREEGGEKADAASGAVDGEDSMKSGPAETLGEKQDETIDQIGDAKEAKADALEDMASERREAAEQEAERLENQAEQARR